MAYCSFSSLKYRNLIILIFSQQQMDLQQAKILLNKINALYKNLSIDEGSISSIERDLMQSYIRQLYEVFIDTDESIEAPVKKAKAPKVVPPKTVPRQEAPAKQYVPPKIIEIPDSLKELATEAPAPPPPPKPKPKPKPQVKPVVTVQTSPTAVNIDSLIEYKQAKELSEKLSLRPIRDLSKALAINDKLLYSNELFGKNAEALGQALSNLNHFSRFEEAIPLLSELAGQFDWLDKEKKSTAKEFIKLVRRRYA